MTLLSKFVFFSTARSRLCRPICGKALLFRDEPSPPRGYAAGHPIAKASIIFTLLLLIYTPSLAQNNDWPQTEARLTAVLASDDVEQKRTALAEIRNIQTEQASRLAVRALSDKNEIVRATAIWAVLFLPPAEASAAVLPLLNDKMPFVRREAALGLGKIGYVSATSKLIQALKTDKDREIRSAAAVALGNIGDPAALGELLNVLNKRPTEDDEFLRRSAARSIGQIFDAAHGSAPPTATPQNFLPPKFKDLGSAKSREVPVEVNTVITKLTQILQNAAEADDTRREAAYALGAIRQPSAAAILRAQLKSPDPYLAEISKEALLKIEMPK